MGIVTDLKVKESKRIVNNYNIGGWVTPVDEEYYTLVLKVNDRDIDAKYIEVDSLIYLRINVGMQNVKDELLKICNKIYNEHMRYRLTNSSYPIYRISMNEYDIVYYVELKDIIEDQNTLKHMVVQNFVNYVSLEFEESNRSLMGCIEEITLPDKVDFDIHGSYVENIKINNYENVRSLSLLGSYMVAKQSRKLQFNCIESLRWSKNMRLSAKLDIIFDDNCTICRLPRAIFTSKSVRSIRLCKSLETLSSIPIKDVIKRDSNGREYLEYEGNTIDIIRD